MMETDIREILKLQGNEESLDRLVQLIREQRLAPFLGAGGVGKSTLALEAARRMAGRFKDGVIGPIRADEYTPMSFAMHLASLLNLRPSEPTDRESATAAKAKEVPKVLAPKKSEREV